MLKFENNPLEDVIKAIEEETNIDATIVFLAENAAGKDAAYGGECDGVKYICLNTAVSFDRLLSGMAIVAAGYASEKSGKSQEEIFKQITNNLVKRKAARYE